MIINKNSLWNYKKVEETKIDKVKKFYESCPFYCKTRLINPINNLYIKDESNRCGIGSFKILGVGYAFLELCKRRINAKICDFYDIKEAAANCKKMVYSATDGNFGVAVSYWCFTIHIKSKIFVPRDIPTYYINLIKKYEGIIVYVDGGYDDCIAKAYMDSELNGGLLLLDTETGNYNYGGNDVIDGYMILFSEINYISYNYIFIQTGVGGLLAAAIRFYSSEEIENRPKIISIEPYNYCTVMKSIQERKICKVVYGDTIINGLKCGQVSHAAWNDIKDGLFASIRINDQEALESYQQMKKYKINSSVTGACGLVGAKELLKEVSDKKILVITTEGRKYAEC